MAARPVWLAVGVVAAAAAVSYAPGGIWVAVVVAAAAVGGAGIASAWGARGRALRARSGHGLADGFAVASLGAACVAARLAFGLALGGAPAPPPTLPAGTGPWTATVEAAHISKGQQIATISTSGAASAAPLRCSALMPAAPRLIAGDTVTWTGRVRSLGSSEYDVYLAGEGIAASCEATNLGVTAHDESPGGRLEAFRQASGDALQRVLPESEGGLAAAILIGLRDRVDREIASAFTAAGVSHIVAISGWNIAIVSACISALLRGVLTRRRRAIVTIAAIVIYTLFAGASASVVRAALMSGVALAAVESGRGSRVTVGLAWAAVMMLLVDPATAADAGFQLSAAATAGLVAWGTPLTRLLDERAPRLPGPIRESLGVSLAAQAATLPIVMIIFGRLALIAPAANLVTVPLVPPIMAAGLLALIAGWFAALGLPGWMGGLVAMPASLLLSALVAIVRTAASIPGGNATLTVPFNLAAAAISAAALVPLHRKLAGGDARRQARPPGTKPFSGDHPPASPRLRWALAAVVLLAFVAGSAWAARPDGNVHVVVLDVGQGDAILIEGDLGGRILVDGGPDANRLLAGLDRFIPAWDRHLDAIVLTHPHDDHVGGLAAVVERYEVDRAFEPGWPADTASYRAWKTALADRGVPVQRLTTGVSIGLDDVTLRVLWPDDGTRRSTELDAGAAPNRQTNDASIVLLGEYENRRFLLTGDAEEDVDPILLARGLPHVDMLKVAHHGSATASSQALLEVLRPGAAAISVGADNDYGHPNGGTLARLGRNSASVYRTDLDGTLDVELDRAGVTVTTSRTRADEAAAERNASASLSISRIPAPAARARVPGLLYDRLDVRTQPSRERGPLAIAPTAGLAPPTLSGGRRNGGLVGVARSFSGSIARPPPRRIGRTAA